MNDEADRPFWIASWRRAWNIHRRVYKIPRGPGKRPWTLPAPNGVAVITVFVYVGCTAVIVVLSLLPVIGYLTTFRLWDWPFRVTLLPGVATFVLISPTKDGRRALRVAWSLIRLRVHQWQWRRQWRPERLDGHLRFGVRVARRRWHALRTEVRETIG
jgi:hypothetical protein